jgi:hypothetical protein
MKPDLLRPLLCRIPLFPDESLPSYLLRVAIANQYEPYSTFTAVCLDRLSAMGLRDTLERPRHPATFDVLSRLTGVEPRTLANASIHLFSQTVLLGGQGQDIRLSDDGPFRILNWWEWSRYLRKEAEAQFCPACLKEFPYHRLAWMPWNITACLKHKCLLVTHCSSCDAPVSLRDIVSGSCSHCSMVLTDTIHHSLEDRPFDLYAQGTLQAWWGVSPSPGSALWSLPPISILVLHRVFEGLKDCLMEKQRIERPGPSTDRFIRHTIQVAALAGLVNWPQGFYTLLQNYLPERGIDGIGCPPYFSRPVALIQTWLFGMWAHDEYEFIQEAFDEFMIEHPELFETKIWRERITSRPGFSEKFHYILKYKASQMLDLPHSVIKMLIQMGKMDAYDRCSREDRWVKREDILEIQKAGLRRRLI